MRVIAISGLLIVAVAIGWLARGWQNSRGPSTAAAEPKTAVVQRGYLKQTVKARGIVKPAPNGLVRLGFPMPKDVSRRIEMLEVVEGDNVKAKEVLAKLDVADLQAHVKLLQADALVVEKRLEAVRTLEPVEGKVAKSLREQAKAHADLAQDNFERAKKLLPTALGSQQAYDAALSEVKVTKAKLENAEASLEQVKAKFKTDIATLEAQVDQAKAAITSAKVQIDWGTLHAPIDGVVFAVHQRQGELTSNQPSAPVLTLLDPKLLQVHLYVDEADFGKIKLGLAVNLRVEAHAGETLKGKIIRFLPQPILQENVVYYVAVAEVEEAKRGLLSPEMTALAHIPVGGTEQVLWLPLAAIKSRADGWYVLRRGPSGPVETLVQIGGKSEGRVEIVSGLGEGEKVLLDQ